MIKRIELVNFMSHVHTVIEPADGLTVLVGPNNCGKSAVMTALQILCHNAPSTYVTRHGEKECSIKVVTDGDDEIVWSRNKTSSKYVINGETFDRLRGKVPDKLLQVLRLPKVALEQSNEEFDIHFGNQKEPVFLLNESGRAAAGFFAASSDASRLIEMQKLYRQKVKDATRDMSRLDKETEQLGIELEALSPVPALKTEFDKCTSEEREIVAAEQTAKRLRQLIEQISTSRKSVLYLGSCSESIAGLVDPPAMHPTRRLGDLTAQINRVDKDRNHLEKISTALNQLAKVPQFEPTTPLRILTSSIRKLEIQSKQLKTRTSLLQKIVQPPKLKDSNRLKELIVGVKRQFAQVRSAEATDKAIVDLKQPPNIAEPKSLQARIAQCLAVDKELGMLEQEFKLLQQSADQLDRQLETYASAHPVCPTCKQPVSQQKLVESVKGAKHG